MKASPASLELKSILDQVIPWARETFPRATPASIAEHLRREATELAANPTSAEEMADVQILLHQLVVYTGTDLAEAVKEKFTANMRRTWGPADVHGVVEHVRERQSWPNYWFDAARLVSTRATCPRASIGAVLVKGKHQIGSGFNGVESGFPHCPNSAEHMALDHCPDAIHAEINTLRNALVPVWGASIYVIGPRPVCPNCQSALTRNGVTNIYWQPR